jgi:hypothetical protein
MSIRRARRLRRCVRRMLRIGASRRLGFSCSWVIGSKEGGRKGRKMREEGEDGSEGGGERRYAESRLEVEKM